MNIETNRSNIHIEENLSVKSNKVEYLNNNLSSSYCPSISFSYEINNELKTELYGRENVETRKYLQLNIPHFIKEYTKQFVDVLFYNEINKRKKNKNPRKANLLNNGRSQSKFFTFYNELSKSVEKRKSILESKRNNNEDGKDITNSYYNINIKAEKNKDRFEKIEKIFDFNFNENENLNINLNDLADIRSDFPHNMDNSFNNDFNEIIQKSFDSKGNDVIDNFIIQNSQINSNIGEFKNTEDFFGENDDCYSNLLDNKDNKEQLQFTANEEFEKRLNEQFNNKLDLVNTNIDDSVNLNNKNKQKINDSRTIHEKKEKDKKGILVDNSNNNNNKINNFEKFNKNKNPIIDKVKDKKITDEFPNNMSSENLVNKINQNNTLEINKNSSFNKNIDSKHLTQSKNKLINSNNEQEENTEEQNNSEDQSGNAEEESELEDYEKSQKEDYEQEIVEENQQQNELNSSSSYEIKLKEDSKDNGKEPSKIEYVRKSKKTIEFNDNQEVIIKNNKKQDILQNKESRLQIKKANKKNKYTINNIKEAKQTQKPREKLNNEKAQIKIEKKFKSKKINENLEFNIHDKLKNEEDQKEINKKINTISEFKYIEKGNKEQAKAVQEPFLMKKFDKEKSVKQSKIIEEPNSNTFKKIKASQSQEKQINPKQKTFTVEKTKKSLKIINSKSKDKYSTKTPDIQKIKKDLEEISSVSEEEKIKTNKIENQSNSKNLKIKKVKESKHVLLIEKLSKKYKEKTPSESTNVNKTNNKDLDAKVREKVNSNNKNFNKISKSPEKSHQTKFNQKSKLLKTTSFVNMDIKSKIEEKVLTPKTKTNYELKLEKDDSELDLSNLSEFAKEKLLNKRIRAENKSIRNNKLIISSNLSVSPNKKTKHDFNTIKKLSNTSSYFFDAKNINSALINKNNNTNSNNLKKESKAVISDNDNVFENTNKLKKLLEIKMQIAKKRELDSYNNSKTKKDENEISNKKLSVNIAKTKSNSLKKKNNISAVKSEIESKSESLSNANAHKRYSNVMSAITNPMSLNDEIDFIFKKIKIFKDAINSNNKDNKEKEAAKTDIAVTNFKPYFKDNDNIAIINSELENNFNLNINSKEVDRHEFGLNPKLTTVQKLDNIKKNFIKQFINNKTLINEKKENIDFKEEFKQLHNTNSNNFFNDSSQGNKVKTVAKNNINNNANLFNNKEKAANDLILSNKDDYKNLLFTANNNLFKHSQQSQNPTIVNGNTKNFDNIAKNKIEIPKNLDNLNEIEKNLIKIIKNNKENIVGNNKENIAKTTIENNMIHNKNNNNNNQIFFNQIKINYIRDSKVNKFVKENLSKENNEVVQKAENSNANLLNKDLLKIPKLDALIGSGQKNSKSPRINNNENSNINIENAYLTNKEKVNENKGNNINNPKDVMKIQLFQELIKKNKNKNKEIQFEYNERKESKKDNSTLYNQERIKSIKKIGSLNIMLKKDANLLSTCIARKPSTANIAEKKTKFNLGNGSPFDKEAKTIPFNHINQNNTSKKEHSEKNLKAIHQININKSKKDFNSYGNNRKTTNKLLELPTMNKVSLNIMDESNLHNNCYQKNDKINQSLNHNYFDNNNDSMKNFIIVHEKKEKMTYNHLLPNKDKFEKIYQNYKEQEKSLKEYKGNSEAESKAYFPNLENKSNSHNIKVINS